MKGYVVIVLLIISATSKSQNVQESDIKFYLYTKDHQDTGDLVNITDATDVSTSEFSASRNTIFYVHGFMGKNDTDSSIKIRNSYVQKYDVNMFIVDWSKLADNIFYPSYQVVVPLGKLLAEMTKKFIEISKLNLQTTSIVGHSLGGHIVGVWGRELNGEVDHIVGLDPAGPFFTKENTENRLTNTSARFVQAIHTSSMLGFFDRLGHADYYPNGGTKQPPCGLDLVEICSHFQSIDYYAESILTGKFKAKKCPSYYDYEHGKCDDGEVSYMGEYDVDKQASGVYFLETNNEPPYAKN